MHMHYVLTQKGLKYDQTYIVYEKEEKLYEVKIKEVCQDRRKRGLIV